MAIGEILRTISSEELFSALDVSLMPFTVLQAVRDASGEIVDFRWTYANPATYRMTGEEPGSLPGQLMSAVRPDLQEKELYRKLVATVETGQAFSSVGYLYFEDRKRYTYMWGMKLGDGYAASFTDLTENYERGEMSMHPLSESELRLELAYKNVEKVEYEIAHSLRAPLRQINASASILLDELSPHISEEHRQLLRRQAQSATGLGRVVDRLLEILRLYATKEIHREHLDMTALAQKIVDRHGPSHEFRIAPKMVTAADRKLTETLLSNLLDNACKFAAPGTEVTVSCAANVFSVSDQGIGFNMAHEARIYELWQRLVLDDEYAGSGMGLAEAHHIVQLHGGWIRAKSRPGTGATFSFVLEQ